MQKQRRSHAIQKLLSDYPFNSCLSYPTTEIQEIVKRHMQKVLTLLTIFISILILNFLTQAHIKQI